MKILHTSDLHLGLSLNNVSFIEDQRHMINLLIETAGANAVEAVLVCGDVFDRAVSSPAAISLYNDMCTRICIDLGIPMLICAGNHDGAARLTSCGELLKRSGLYIAGKISDCTQSVLINDTEFHFLPYFTIDEARALYPDAEIKSYAEAVEYCIGDIKLNPNKRNVLLAHLFTMGSETCESDRSAVAGGSSVVPAELFAGFDYTALGHLHKPQSIKNTRYSGTPLKYSFAESNHKKSFIIIDTTDMAISEIEIKPMRDLRILNGTYDELTESAVPSDDYIKIELTDKFPSMSIDKQFQEIYPNLLQCTGRSLISEHSAVSVTASELTGMTAVDILTRYCSEVAGIELDDEMIDWFNESVAAAEETERSGDI